MKSSHFLSVVVLQDVLWNGGGGGGEGGGEEEICH